jgi:tocopherol cyclase
MLRRPLNAYRSTGADPPFTDPAGAHGTAMEGYYWRVVDANAGSVIVLGIRRGPNGPWAAVALAAHPAGVAQHAVAAPAAAEPRSFVARAARVLRGSADGSSMHLGETHGSSDGCDPHSSAGTARGWRGVLGGVRLRLDGATAYMEKN